MSIWEKTSNLSSRSRPGVSESCESVPPGVSRARHSSAPPRCAALGCPAPARRRRRRGAAAPGPGDASETRAVDMYSIDSWSSFIYRYISGLESNIYIYINSYKYICVYACTRSYPKTRCPQSLMVCPNQESTGVLCHLGQPNCLQRSITIQSPLPETSQHRPYHTGSTPQINKPAGYAGLYNYGSATLMGG